MNKNIVSKSLFLCPVLCISPVLGQEDSTAAVASEILVTGSLIPRQSFSQSSPVDILEGNEMTEQAPVSMADFFADLPYVTGSSFQSGRAVGSTFGNGDINLRGLGADATLVLLNSRRQSQLPSSPDNVVDINSLVPEIMIQRMEVLKDGASALYGSDAVGGVINIITRDDFEGFEVRARAGTWDYSDTYNQRYELLWGTGNDTTHIVTGFSFYDQDGMFSIAGDSPQQEGIQSAPGSFPNGAQRFSSATSSPGRFGIPQRDASGALITDADGGPTYGPPVIDSNCGNVLGSSVDGNSCRYYFWDDNAVQSDIERKQVFSRLSHSFDNSIEFTGEAGFSTITSAASWTAGDPVNGQVVPGHNPGNEYRAQDTDGNPLYAVSSGTSAGYSRFMDGAMQEVFLPARDNNGHVILTDNPRDPGSGIPFYEDVIFSGRPIGSQGALPTNNSFELGEFAASRLAKTTSDVFRIGGALSGDISDVWSWQTSANYSQYYLETDGTLGIANQPNLTAALQGLGGPACNQVTGSPGVGGCEYFNIFGNRTFADPDSPRANSQEVIDFVLPDYKDTYKSELLVYDAILTGELFTLPAGPLGFAAGYQRREETLAVDFDTTKNNAQTVQGTAQYDFDNTRVTDAFYTELRAPLMDNEIGNLEVNAALRYEEIGDDETTTDPKIGVVFNTVNDVLTLRASYSTSFIAPSLFRLYATSGGGAGVDDCPVGYHPACLGEPNIRISQQNVGNPDLEPQTSTAWAAGLEYRPLENLSLQLDWWTFEFENQIMEEGTNDVLLEDPDGSITGRVFRDATGRLTRVDTTYFNAASTTTSGMDFGVNYQYLTDGYGAITAGISGSYVYEYEYAASPGSPTVDALGMTNDGGGPPVPPNTKLRMILKNGWQNGPHSANVRINYIGKVESTRVAGFEVDPFIPVDLSYRYTFEDPGFSFASASIGVGVDNAFNETSDVIPFPSFQPFIASMHDLRGRMIWLSLQADF